MTRINYGTLITQTVHRQKGHHAMSIAAAGHIGPWTIEDVEGLPDQGDHARYELLTPGVLTVTPAPAPLHQRASFHLATRLVAAVAAADAPFEMFENVNVEVPGGRLTIPDIVLIDRVVADQAASLTRFPSSAVLLAVEIVSPNSHPQDRIIKPQLYAEAGIHHYWRLELEERPHLIAFELSNGRYRRRLTALGGMVATIEAPYPMQLDPAALTRP